MFCPFCGVEIPDRSTFCGFCGKKIPDSEPAAEAVEQAAEVIAEPAAEAVEQASEVIAEPAAEAVEQASEVIAEPAAEAVEQASEVIAEPVAEAVEDAVSFDGETVMQSNTAGGKAFNISALLKNKMFLICVGAVVLLVVLIIIIANAAASGASKNPKKGSYIVTKMDGEGIVFYNGSLVKGTDLSNYSNMISESLDGTKALVYSDEELFLFNNGKQFLITDELYSTKAKLSDSGAVVYISDGSLYFYSDNKSKEIAELDEPSQCEFAISPDGGTVVFSEYSYDDDDYWNSNKKYKNLNAWNGKKVIELDDKFAPYYVSNGGKLICGKDANGKFTYLKNLKSGSAEKLKTFSNMYPVSADYSKIMYYNSEGDTYYFDSGLKDSIKVSSKDFSILMPGDYPSFPKDLKSFYATSNGGIVHYYKSKDSYDYDKLASSAYNVKMSADGKTIIYLHNDEIRRISVSNPDKWVTVAEDVYDSYYGTSFDCDSSLKHVYYFDDDHELHYASKRDKRIASDVDEFYVNDSGICVFLTDDGDLYYSSKGGDKVKISGISDAVGIMLQDNIFYAGTDDTVYVSKDGKKFTKLYEW